MTNYVEGQRVVGGKLESGGRDTGRVLRVEIQAIHDRALVQWDSGLTEWVMFRDLKRLADEAARVMSPGQLCVALTNAELGGGLQPDTKRIIRDERMRLQAALQSGDASRIAPAAKEAHRVAVSWGVLND